MKFVLLALAALVAIAAANELTEETYATTVGGAKPAFVKFYAPCEAHAHAATCSSARALMRAPPCPSFPLCAPLPPRFPQGVATARSWRRRGRSSRRR